MGAFHFIRLMPARVLIALGFRRLALRYLGQLKASSVNYRDVDVLRAACFRLLGEDGNAIEALKEEVRLNPSNTPALIALRSHQVSTALTVVESGELPPECLRALNAIRPYTMVGEKRLLALLTNARRLCDEDVPGNLAECGVAAGGSAALLAWAVSKFSKRARKVFAFDTFRGLPPPGKVDTHGEKRAAALGWGAGTCAAPTESLMEIAKLLKVDHLITPVAGLFSETLPKHIRDIQPLALLHMDGDWYDSTMDILVHAYDAVSRDGYIQIDDFGYWAGCRLAVDDFQKERNLCFALEDIDGCGVALRKN